MLRRQRMDDTNPVSVPHLPTSSQMLQHYYELSSSELEEDGLVSDEDVPGPSAASLPREAAAHMELMDRIVLASGRPVGGGVQQVGVSRQPSGLDADGGGSGWQAARLGGVSPGERPRLVSAAAACEVVDAGKVLPEHTRGCHVPGSL